MIIANKPHAVWWLHNGMHYQLQEVRPQEFDRLTQGIGDIVGVPKIFCLRDDDVEWWPQSVSGEPHVVL